MVCGLHSYIGVMNTSRLGWLLVAGVIGFGAGCAAKDDGAKEDPKEDEFAVLPVDQLSSVLPAIEDSEGQPDICVGMIGFTPAEAKTKFEELKLQLTDAMNQWNALLAGNPLWHFKGQIAELHDAVDRVHPDHLHRVQRQPLEGRRALPLRLLHEELRPRFALRVGRVHESPHLLSRALEPHPRGRGARLVHAPPRVRSPPRPRRHVPDGRPTSGRDSSRRPS